jgi:GrpB-like predicted nucleotidyltransferase (UPF0157 family)
VEGFRQKLARVLAEEVAVEPYDPAWPEAFRWEAEHLRGCLPAELIGRIEHFGSTAVPGLAAKPIIDMLVEVWDPAEVRRRVPPILEPQGYDYFWRPTWGDDTPPWYAWFIRRGADGRRTHHIHMVEPHFEHWDRLLFRDYLIERLDLAQEYAALKLRLARVHAGDRVAYTRAKTDFILRVTEEARRRYGRDG